MNAAVLSTALLLLTATAVLGGVIVDPARDNGALLGHRCNATHDTCSSGRLCAFDELLASDPVLNVSCAGPDSAECYVCLHKSLFPLGSTDAYGTALLFLAGVLAGASGIGGGGLNVPLLMLVQGFIIEEAVPLSHVMVFGNAVAQNLVNLQRRHPKDARRPLVDFDIPLLLLPMQLGGNAVGVTLSPVLPSTVLVLLSCAVLLLAAAKTLHRAFKDFKQESLANRESAGTRGGTIAGVGAVSIGSTPSDLDPLLDGHVEPLSSTPIHEPRRGVAGAASGAPGGLPTTAAQTGYGFPALSHAFPALSSAFPATWACAAPEVSSPSRSALAAPRHWWHGKLRSRSHHPAEPPHTTSTTLKVGSLVLFWAFFIADYFGVQVTHAHDRCSALYLGWQGALLVAVGISSAVGAHLAMQTSRGRAALPGDIQWATPTIVGATILVRRPVLCSLVITRGHSVGDPNHCRRDYSGAPTKRAHTGDTYKGHYSLIWRTLVYSFTFVARTCPGGGVRFVLVLKRMWCWHSTALHAYCLDSESKGSQIEAGGSEAVCAYFVARGTLWGGFNSTTNAKELELRSICAFVGAWVLEEGLSGCSAPDARLLLPPVTGAALDARSLKKLDLLCECSRGGFEEQGWVKVLLLTRDRSRLLSQALLIGMVAGLIGLGGGELMAPLLLALGMLPQVRTLAPSVSAAAPRYSASSHCWYRLPHCAFQPSGTLLVAAPRH